MNGLPAALCSRFFCCCCGLTVVVPAVARRSSVSRRSDYGARAPFYRYPHHSASRRSLAGRTTGPAHLFTVIPSTQHLGDRSPVGLRGPRSFLPLSPSLSISAIARRSDYGARAPFYRYPHHSASRRSLAGRTTGPALLLTVIPITQHLGVRSPVGLRGPRSF